MHYHLSGRFFLFLFYFISFARQYLKIDTTKKVYIYSYFEKGWRINVHATIPKVIWDMINTLFLTTVPVEPTFVAFL